MSDIATGGLGGWLKAVLTRLRQHEGWSHLGKWGRRFCPWQNLTLFIVRCVSRMSGSHHIDLLPFHRLIKASGGLV